MLQSAIANRNAAFLQGGVSQNKALALIFFRLSREPLNPLGDGRMSGKEIANAGRGKRLDNKKVRRSRRSYQGQSLRIRIQLLQGACERIRIVRDAGTRRVSFIFTRARNP